jgi:molybdenum cofactor cytidylyltransferase
VTLAHPKYKGKSDWNRDTVHGALLMNTHEIRPSAADTARVSAILLAAGMSRRMGVFKLTLPWRGTTVIQHVADTLRTAGLHEIVAVTGHRRHEIEAALAGRGIRCVFNPNYATGDMLSSIQTGIAALDAGDDAVLVCLGDQPQMEAATLRLVLAEGERTSWKQIIIPSYRMRAGHPILIPRSLWLQIMDTTESLRAILRVHANSIEYLTVDTPTILADLDTPDDYANANA